MKRELFEETGIFVPNTSKIDECKPLYIQKPSISYIYHMYRLYLTQQPKVRITSEHQASGWFSLAEMLKLPLMAGAKEALDHYYEQNHGE